MAGGGTQSARNRATDMSASISAREHGVTFAAGRGRFAKQNDSAAMLPLSKCLQAQPVIRTCTPDVQLHGPAPSGTQS